MSLETIDICRTTAGIEPVSMDTPVQGSELVLGDTAVFGSTPSAEDEYFSEQEGTLSDAMLRLDDETRQMLVLHYGLDGRVPQTIHMVASRYRMPPVVVKQRITEALQRLKETYEAF